MYEIEVESGKWEKIPCFDVSEDLKEKLGALEFYGVEKCHPQFFEWDTGAFFAGVRHLESLGVKVKLVYLVRDPS